MNNLLVLPMVAPILTAILLVFLTNRPGAQRLLALLSIVLTAGISAYLLERVRKGGILRLDFGGWLPPHGISFVADSFALLLVVTSSIITGILLIYAFATTSRELESKFFYPFIFFLVAGVNGSFLTGDIFNLFVCFEVMLLSSYALIAIGGRKVQLAESIKYIAINVLSSWFFLLAIAYLYGTVGTLNMAHIAVRVGEAGQGPMLTVVSLVFLLVFSLKAGLLLYFWLPGSYSVPRTAVAALFGALLTKVGMYAMFRVFTLIFHHQPDVTHTLIGLMALLTMIGGSIGAISTDDVKKIISYNVVISVGFIMIGLAVSTDMAFQGAVYYLIHDMVAKALLFLAGGTMVYLAGTSRISRMSGLIRNYPVLGWLFFVSILSLVGIPPLSGFIGKVFIGEGAIEAGAFVLLGAGFISSLFVLYSLLRIFMNCFWGETIMSEEDEMPMTKGMAVPIVLLGVLTAAIGLGAEFISPYVEDAARTLSEPGLYIDAVLPGNEGPSE